MLLSGLDLRSSGKLWRAACIACMPFVLAFIAFNLLDLDGSNLLSLTRCSGYFAADADILAAPRIDPLPDHFEYLPDRHIQKTNKPSDLARRYISELLSPSRLEKARNHLYHVSLPRDAVPG